MGVITVVGGANVDVQGFPSNRLRAHDSNPGRIGMSAGGVGRNIAENLVRLGHTVRLVTVLGDDEQGRFLLENLRAVGVETTHVAILPNRSTSTYLCILDADATLYAAVADMTILGVLDPDLLTRQTAAFEGIDLCIVDANLEEAAIERALELAAGTRCLLDPVSAAKASRAKRYVGGFYATKPNEAELEVLSDIEIGADGDLSRAVKRMHEAGTHSVFVSLGARGLYFSDGHRRGRAAIQGASVINVSGAGDAMTAAIAGALADGKPIEEIAALAVSAAAITTESESTVSPLMSVEAVGERARRVVLHEEI